uniref:Uncharacterized protein n=1 Tax=Avena sativa TaxID=4498 RepID=A0ACD5TPZ8_AVESA
MFHSSHRFHQFIKQYTKMVDEQENNDSEAEKKNKQKKIKLTVHYPIERHGLEIYTHVVYHHFLKELLKVSSYVVTKYIPGQMFEVTHVDAEKREVWSRVVYKISINEVKKTFLCECGLFEHFCILSCHALKALLHMGASKIPDAHIMKRWTKNARSSPLGKSFRGFADEDLSFNRALRHKRLYMAALEMVRLGEEDDAMSEIAFKNIEKANKEMSAFKKTKTSTCQVGYGSCRSDDGDDIFHPFGVDSSDTDGVELHIRDPRKKIMIPVSTIKPPIIPVSAGLTKVKRYKSRLHGTLIKDKVLDLLQQSLLRLGDKQECTKQDSVAGADPLITTLENAWKQSSFSTPKPSLMMTLLLYKINFLNSSIH